MNLEEQLAVVQKVGLRYWSCLSGACEESLEKIRVIKHTGGKIMGFLPTFENHPEVFYKVYFYDRGFNYESAGLRTANAMPQVDDVCVPKLVAIYPEYKAILTEKEDWEEDRSDLQRFTVGSLGIDWFQIGRWLRTFHDSQVSYKKNDYFLRKKFEKIESHLEVLQSLFTVEELGKMRQIIDVARAYFDTAEIEWVISHGDFGLANIQKKGDELEIIDFEDCQFAPRVFDVLNCFVRMEYANYFPSLKCNFIKIKSKFLEGYSYKLNFGTPDQKFFYLLIKLEIIESYFRRKRKNKLSFFQSRIFNFFEKTALRSLNSWMK